MISTLTIIIVIKSPWKLGYNSSKIVLHSTYTIHQFTDTCNQERCAPSRALGWMGETEDLTVSCRGWENECIISMVDRALQIDAHMCTHIISISHRSGTLIWTRIHAAHRIVWVRLIGGFHKEENCHYAGLQHSGWLTHHCTLSELAKHLYSPRTQAVSV